MESQAPNSKMPIDSQPSPDRPSSENQNPSTYGITPDQPSKDDKAGVIELGASSAAVGNQPSSPEDQKPNNLTDETTSFPTISGDTRSPHKQNADDEPYGNIPEKKTVERKFPPSKKIPDRSQSNTQRATAEFEIQAMKASKRRHALDPYEFEELFEYDQRKKPQNGRWNWTKYYIGWFCFHGRTERALRTTTFFIPALLFSYYAWVGDTNFAYSCALFYALMSALIPPMISGVSVLLMMAFFTAIIGVTFATAAWSVGLEKGWALGPVTAMFLLFILMAAVLAPLKIGKATALTGMGALIAAYACELPFFMTFKYIADGINFDIPLETLVEWLKSIDIGSIPLPPIPIPPPVGPLPPESWLIVIDAVKTALSLFLATGTSMYLDLKLPQEIVHAVDPEFDILADLDVILNFSAKGLHVHIPSGFWVIQVAWEGNGKLAVVKAILIYGGIAMALFIISLLMPPQRYSRSWLRRRLATITRESGALLHLIGESIQLVEARQPKASISVSESLSEGREIAEAIEQGYAKSPEEQHRIVVTSIDALDPKTTRGVPYVKLEEKSLLQSLYERQAGRRPNEKDPRYTYGSRRTESSLYPTTEEGEAESTRFLRDEKVNRKYLKDELDETVRKGIVALSDLSPLVVVSAMEPSLSNPGIFVNYFLKWPAIFDSLRRCYVHSGAFWDLVKPPRESKGNENGPNNEENNAVKDSVMSWPGLPTEKDCLVGENTELLKRLTLPARHTATLTIECFELMADLIGMKPVSRGPQLVTADRLKEVLHDKVFKLVIMRDQLSAESNLLKSFQESPKMRDWRMAVSSHAARLEFHQMVVEAPLQLAIAVDHLVTAQSQVHVVRGLSLNIVGWLLPLLAILATLLKNILLLLMPWKWRWRMQHPRYLGTGQPWYRNTDVLFCYRWAVGLLSLAAMTMFWDNFRTWIVSGESSTEGLMSIAQKFLSKPMTAKVAAWTSLGFLTTIFMTVEGTVHRAGLRLIGVVIGTLSGLLCLVIVGDRSIAGQITWIVVTVFISIWIGGNPVSAVLGYHPSWGYAAQVFTYQETIIIVEAYYSVQPRNELVAARFVGQFIGISTACLVSSLLVPNQANVTIRQCIVQALHCSTESVIAIAESLMLAAHVIDGNPCVSDSRPWDEPKRRTFAENLIHGFQKTIEAKRAPEKLLVASFHDQERASQLQDKRKFFVTRSNSYHNDAKAAVDKIGAHVRDATVFRELPVCGLDFRWHDAILALQFMMLHREAFADLASLPSLPSIGPHAHDEFSNLLHALKHLSELIAEELARDVSGWYPGYNRNLLIGVLGYIPAIREWQRRQEQHEAEQMMHVIEKGTAEVYDALNALGKTYQSVFSSAEQVGMANLAGLAQEEFSSHPVDCVDPKLQMTRELWLWLTTTHCLLRFSSDLKSLVKALTGESAVNEAKK